MPAVLRKFAEPTAGKFERQVEEATDNVLTQLAYVKRMNKK